MQSHTLLQTLTAQVRSLIQQAEALKSQDPNDLLWRKHEQSWNILECMEHLNLYGEFYLPQIRRKIDGSAKKADAEFKTGFLGNRFAESMLPVANFKKMKTFKDKNPIHARLDKTVIDRFIDQQRELLQLLQLAAHVSLNRVRIPTSISSMLRLNLGDTFRFLINHMVRHFSQIERIQEARKAKPGRPELSSL